MSCVNHHHCVIEEIEAAILGAVERGEREEELNYGPARALRLEASDLHLPKDVAPTRQMAHRRRRISGCENS